MMKHFLSDLSAFRRDPLRFLLERGNSHDGPLLKLNLGPSPVFLVNTPELIKPILNADECDFDKGRLIRKLRAALGISLLSLSGVEYQRRRPILHSHMARGPVLKNLPEMAAAIRGKAAQLARQRQFDAHEMTAPLTLRLICIALFGRQVLTDTDEAELLKAIQLIEDELADDMFRVLPRSPRSHFRMKRRFALAHSIMDQVVHRVRKHAAQSSVLKGLEGLGLSDGDIRNEVLTMLLAGHHTTGAAASWLLYHLAQDPELAAKIASEAHKFSGASGEIRGEQLASARVSLNTAKETLRLYPSAWWFSREVKRDLSLGGHQLKRGTSLMFSPWQLHHDPRQWERPNDFDIERTYSSGAYLPFGAGPRACMGMGIAMQELQLIALEFCAAYELEVISAPADPIPRASVTLVPPRIKIGLQVRGEASDGPSIRRESTMAISG